MPVNIGNTVDAVLTYAREYLCIRPGSRKQERGQGVIGIEAVRTARSRIIVARARQAWTISAVSIALDLLTVAVEEPSLEEVASILWKGCPAPCRDPHGCRKEQCSTWRFSPRRRLSCLRHSRTDSARPIRRRTHPSA